MTAAWSAPTTPDEVARRAAGRTHYNTRRKHLAMYRRGEVLRLLRVQGSLFEHGVRSRIARQLGVHRSTISRDVAYLIRLGRPCPTCGALQMPPATDAAAR